MANYWKLVNDVIREADILLEILDGRSIDETRNIEIEDKVKKSGKVLIYVINKCDLVDKDKMEA
ncbi:GTPase, partial [archaeon]|nr:GTPase [archaeon]